MIFNTVKPNIDQQVELFVFTFKLTRQVTPFKKCTFFLVFFMFWIDCTSCTYYSVQRLTHLSQIISYASIRKNKQQSYQGYRVQPFTSTLTKGK